MKIVTSFDPMVFAGQLDLLDAGECDGFVATNQGGLTKLAFPLPSRKLAFSAILVKLGGIDKIQWPIGLIEVCRRSINRVMVRPKTHAGGTCLIKSARTASRRG
jgi:hypothetical protein